LLEKAGLPARIVSGGGTGTYDITGDLPPVNEVQAGSYVFMDCTYLKVRPEFKSALTVLTSVVSRSISHGMVVDAGLKAVTKEFGWPQPVGIEGASVRYLSEEHGVLDLAEPERVPSRPGDKVSFIPSHCCTTVNLHDNLYVVQEGSLVDIWPIAARGRAQ
jgi:D-serine deaminase-like pyridoxal phosphate-dependent protein